MLKVQLAIQGGGAKICGLLAAADAIQALERAGKLQVTRIAGTSAGAIVGALYAADADLSAIRDRVRDPGNASLLARLFPDRTRVSAAWHVVNGWPIWNEKTVQDLLNKEFTRLSVFNLGDIARKAAGRRLKIVATDLQNGQSIVYEKDTDVVVSSILDSCGIPFFFRVPGKHHIVDGGICENLPVELLEDDREKYGPILAVGFQRHAGSAPDSLLSFSASLLDTAMNHSMQRARARVLDDCLFEVRPQFGTFDFTGAIAKGFGDFYDAERGRAKAHFEDVVKRLEVPADAKAPKKIGGDPWSRIDRETLLKLGDMWRNALPKQAFRYHSTEFVVQANSLCPPDHPYYGQPDIMTTRAFLTPRTWPFFYHSIAFSSNPGGTGPAQETALLERSWGVFDGSGSPIPTTHLPMLDREFTLDRRMLLFFTPPLDGSSAFTPPFSVHFRDLGDNVLVPLLNKGEDYLSLSFDRAEGTVEVAKLILYLPKGGMPVRCLPDEASRLAGAQPLNAVDLANAPAGFSAQGVVVRNIPGDQSVRMNVFRVTNGET